MGRLQRIAKAILREMNVNHPKVIEVPAVPKSEMLSGRFALITGGTSGIGLEIAKRFLRSGCNVVIAGTNEEKIRRVVNEFDTSSLKGCKIDVTDISSIKEGVRKSISLFPKCQGIDILVNSAGVQLTDKFGSVSEETFDKVMDTNLKGTFFMSQEVSNHMIERGIRGHILNISSSSALRNAKNPYEISKWGIKGLTLGFAERLIKEGIVVNAIGPGPTATPLFNRAADGSLSHVSNPSGRLAHPGEIANLALILVSSTGDLIVGDTLYVTGGAGTICIDR